VDVRKPSPSVPLTVSHELYCVAVRATLQSAPEAQYLQGNPKLVLGTQIYTATHLTREIPRGYSKDHLARWDYLTRLPKLPCAHLMSTSCWYPTHYLDPASHQASIGGLGIIEGVWRLLKGLYWVQCRVWRMLKDGTHAWRCPKMVQRCLKQFTNTSLSPFFLSSHPFKVWPHLECLSAMTLKLWTHTQWILNQFQLEFQTDNNAPFQVSETLHRCNWHLSKPSPPFLLRSITTLKPHLPVCKDLKTTNVCTLMVQTNLQTHSDIPFGWWIGTQTNSDLSWPWEVIWTDCEPSSKPQMNSDTLS
jgi:hypothetical protein